MNRKHFARLVAEALDSLPEKFASRLVNVEVVIEEEPSRAQLRSTGLDPKSDTLFGLYEGIPLEERALGDASLPDKISIFYRPIVESCASPEAIRDEIRTTVLHEIAHFFGIDDQDLDAWGY